jgi:hypothetical protein
VSPASAPPTVVEVRSYAGDVNSNPAEIATVMHFRNERVVSMQDYRTEAEALAAVDQK